MEKSTFFRCFLKYQPFNIISCTEDVYGSMVHAFDIYYMDATLTNSIIHTIIRIKSVILKRRYVELITYNENMCWSFLTKENKFETFQDCIAYDTYSLLLINVVIM